MIASVVGVMLFSCNKGENFIDNTSSFPLGWKSSDSLPVVAYNMKDTVARIVNVGTCPLGVEVNPNFGKLKSSLYINFETTLSSVSFSFASIDSAVLILPYYRTIPTYGTVSSIDISAYELTEALETSTSSKKDNYTFNPVAVGQKLGYKPNYTDSVVDGNGKISPSIRIPLSLALAQKIIAPGSYADNASLQAVFRGLHIAASDADVNGFLMILTNNECQVKIYGKNALGENILSVLASGGNNSTAVNKYERDLSSAAQTASTNSDKVLGDDKLYNMGLASYYTQLRLPNLAGFSKDKSIFKAELSLYTIDSSFAKSPGIGLLFQDSLSGTEFLIEDQSRLSGFLISTKDTTINGIQARRYTYNLGLHCNNILSGFIRGHKINIYSYPLTTGGAKFSNFLPSQVVMAGSKAVQPLRPKLTLYYIDKK
jgi:hypothetical protein